MTTLGTATSRREHDLEDLRAALHGLPFPARRTTSSPHSWCADPPPGCCGAPAASLRIGCTTRSTRCAPSWSPARGATDSSRASWAVLPARPGVVHRNGSFGPLLLTVVHDLCRVVGCRQRHLPTMVGLYEGGSCLGAGGGAGAERSCRRQRPLAQRTTSLPAATAATAKVRAASARSPLL